MNVIIFGATGMVGQGVLRECLLDSDVERVLSLGRSSTGTVHPKLREIVHKDLFHYGEIESELQGFDACFFCLGVSAAGMSEQGYRHITYDLTLSAANTLLRLNSGMTFIYVSGTGTDANGRMMWSRVKGATENALLGLSFRAAYMFRPGYIQPMHGTKTKTRWYGAMYAVMAPLYPVWRTIIPKYVTTTESVGRAMLTAAKCGAPSKILESAEINRLAQTRI